MIAAQPPILPWRSADVLVFQTPPLERETEVTGEIHVTLWISSSAVDSDFTAKLATFIRRRGLSARVRYEPRRLDHPDSLSRQLEREKLMVPASLPRADPNPPTSNLFTPGAPDSARDLEQQLPTLRPESEYGRAGRQHTHSIVARNTVYCDSDRHHT